MKNVAPHHHRPRTTTCPTCRASYQLNRVSLGHRAVCQKCRRNFYLLPTSDLAPTLVNGKAGDSTSGLIGRLWLDLRPGQIVAGRYLVKRLLGQGGLSRIFQITDLARQPDGSPPRTLALKLPLASTMDRLPYQVFLDEAAAWLKPAPHPNLVTCEGVRLIMGQPGIFMEFVNGSDLARLIYSQGGKFFKNRVSATALLLDTFIQVARGLRYAHSLGLANLDVKPRNVLMEKGGRVLIGDYGPLSDLAAVPPEEAAVNSRPDNDETELSTTRLLGTPQYFSPEAARGLSGAGLSTDLWALTLTALETFLGLRPWEMGSIVGRSLDHYLYKFEPLVPIPAPMVKYFGKALDDNPKRRHQSAGEVEEHLTDIYKEITGRAYKRPPARLRPESPERLRLKAASFLELGLSEQAELLLKV